ncbi:MAG: SDR family oxidoreductase [Burkholderiales bacterium]|nr:SDR family oxidoreductase [Burkholderiales bacterium]
MSSSEFKSVIITGGSSGIGKATAILLAQHEYNIAIIGRRKDLLEEAVLQISQYKVNPLQQIIYAQADVCDSNAINLAIQNIIDQIGAPSVVITSAGMAHPGYFAQLSNEIFEQTMQTNFFGTLYTIKAVVPFMRKAKSGHIILISSGAGLIGIFGYTAYAASKFAIRGFGEALRPELKKDCIDVSIVYPSDVETPQLIAENKLKPLETKIISGAIKPLKPEQIATAILKGIKHKNFIITVGYQIKLMNRLHSLIAPLLNRYLDYIIK